MINNIEDVEKFLEDFEELETLALPVGKELAELRGYYGQMFDGEIIIDCGNLCYRYETGGRGDYDSHDIVIPIEYLFDDEWLEEAKAEKMRKNIAAVEKKKEADAKKERLAKAQRYEKYIDLCKEFDENA